MWWRTFYNKFHQNETTVIVKYVILFWTTFHNWETKPFENGQDALYRKNCDYKNCYFTNNRNYFGKSLKEFDAIIFSDIRQKKEDWYIRNLPKPRYLHQKYIFLSAEPSEPYPLCSKSFDNFFNWTYTYKLDSDCHLTYVRLENNEGKIIYPEKNMHWVNSRKEVSDDIKRVLAKKSKPIAWFVSHCSTNSKREGIYEQLKTELLKYNLQIDVFGQCGKYKCSNPSNYKSCYGMLERDYFFYLAFENSVCEDYVSEKVLHALVNKVVPIVYGGANYSRFLPPGSYLDIRTHNIQEIVRKVRYAMINPSFYLSFFKWTNHYKFLNNASGVTYSDVDVRICEFCKLMNSKQMKQYSTRTNMRSWWSPTYEQRCNEYKMSKLKKFQDFLQPNKKKT